MKRRFAFVVERWGGSGAIFAWDLWNELGHDHGVASEAIGPELAVQLIGIVSGLSHFVRETELRLFGRTHLQTVSHFGAEPKGPLADLIFRHPDLDFATTHVYEPGDIDAPTNTVAAADGHGPMGPARRSARSAMAARSPTAKPARSTRSRTWASRSPSSSTSTISATCPGPTSPAAEPAEACAGPTGTRIR